MRRFVLIALLMVACERNREPTPDNAAAQRAPLKPGAELLVGSWQVEGFEATNAATSASAAALEAQASSPEAQSVRITYTADAVRIHAPGQAVLSSPYHVLESKPGFVHIKNGNDDVLITFRDDDHMTVDRKGNAYGAKMKMKRAAAPPPEPLASSTVALPFGSAKVVGTNSAGHPIVKIGP